MIIPMQKLTFLVTAREYKPFVSFLRKVGVVHIQQTQSGATSEEFEAGQAMAKRYAEAIKILDVANGSHSAQQDVSRQALPAAQDLKKEGERILESIEQLQQQELKTLHSIESVEKTIDKLEPWGNFDSSRWEFLKAEGLQINCFSCPTKMVQAEWSDKYYATPINQRDGRTYFLTFSDAVPNIAAEHVELPEHSLHYYQDEKKGLKDRLEEIRQNLRQINGEKRHILEAAQVANKNEIALSNVQLQTTSLADDQVKMIVGWLPAAETAEITAQLDAQQIYYEVSEPQLEEDVPVQLKNNSFSKLFEPILRMYSLPNYHDVDILPHLAPFFLLFFGLCLGDAGYGLLVVIISLFVIRKPKLKSLGQLGLFLGGCAIFCGLLTGSFAGIDLSQQDWAFLAPVKGYFINDNHKIFGYSPMMVISVIIGLVQVLLGITLAACKAAKNHGWRYGIGKLSWVIALVTLTLTFGLPLCGVPLPKPLEYLAMGILAVSVIGIFFYNSPGKNIFVNFGGGLWNTYGMASGLLGDLLSYVRLYALGLTGGVLGGVFNSLAVLSSSSLPWYIAWLPFIVVLLFGHTLNFALCMISSFVHPMRLTFVEFFKNAEFEGGGKEYNPFHLETYKES